MASTNPSSDNNDLSPVHQKNQKPLSDLQQQFNEKVEEIERLKAKMTERKQVLDEAKVRVQREIQPLVKELVLQRIAFVKALDKVYHYDYLSKLEQDKLAFLIKELSFPLIENNGAEELRPLHDRYASMFQTEEEAINANAKEEAQNKLKEMLGLEVEEDELNDMEAFQAKLDAQMREEQEKRDAQQANRQKNSAQAAKDKKIKAELQDISKASRRLYTTLVKLLHPDKEQDPAARLWKEEALKKVTIAYNQDDFYELLRLQLEFMHEQENHLDQVPEEQLHYYLKLLTEQVKELQEAEHDFFLGPDASLFHNFGGSAKQMEAKFREAKRAMRAEIDQVQDNISNFQDPLFLREYLKIHQF